MHDYSLRFANLALGYEGLPAIQNITGTIQKGSLTAIIGPNGSGKSTLLKGIAGILAPLSGSCTVEPKARIAYLPQISELDRTFPATVSDLVSLGLWPERGLFRHHRIEDRKRLTDALGSVGLAGFEKRQLSALSGGQSSTRSSHGSFFNRQTSSCLMSLLMPLTPLLLMTCLC
ncbi:ATP-binding cassette domain-containing protein [Klebsiella pneumoniae]